jgi:hypothetical protein
MDVAHTDAIGRLKKTYAAPFISALNREKFEDFLERLDFEFDRLGSQERKEIKSDFLEKAKA